MIRVSLDFVSVHREDPDLERCLDKTGGSNKCKLTEGVAIKDTHSFFEGGLQRMFFGAVLDLSGLAQRQRQMLLQVHI